MMKKSIQKNKLTAWGCIMALMLVLVLLVLHAASGTPVFAPSAYNLDSRSVITMIVA